MQIRTILVIGIISAIACSAPAPPVAVSATPAVASASAPSAAVPSASTPPSPLVTAAARPPAEAIVVTTVALGPLHGEIAWVSRLASNPNTPGPAGNRSLATYELWAMPLDGSTPRMAVRYQSAVTGAVVVPSGSGPGTSVGGRRDTNVLRRQFSPDGRRIVLSVAANADVLDQELRVIDLETGAIAIPIPGSSFPGAAPIDVNPAWSPDGARIAFVKLSATGASGELWVMNADGGAATRIWTGCSACLPSSELIHVATAAPRVYGWLPGSQRIAMDPATSGPGAYAVVDLNGQVSPSGDFVVTSVDPASWGSASQMFVVGARQAGLPADRSQILQGAGPEQHSLQVIADVTVNPYDNTVTGVRDPRWDPQGSAALIYLESGVQGAFVLADVSARTSKLLSGRVAYADWMSNGDVIVTLEVHPATAPLSVYVYQRDGRLRAQLPGIAGYVLTDLAARAY